MKVKIKKLDPKAVIPTYFKVGDAALDLTAIDVKPHRDFIECYTGLAIEIPENHVGLIFPRSSISYKDLTLTNSVGVIDSSYRGEIRFRFKPAISHSGNNHYGVRAGYGYSIGDRIGQLIIIPYPKIELEEVSELSETERGTGGWGSSGK